MSREICYLFDCPNCGNRLKEIFKFHYKCLKCGNYYMNFSERIDGLRQKSVKDFLI